MKRDNLEVLAHLDGTWLSFKASNGQSLLIQVEAMADREKHSSIGHTCLKQWCEDRQREALRRCPRCGEKCESEDRPEGCRDPNCPIG